MCIAVFIGNTVVVSLCGVIRQGGGNSEFEFSVAGLRLGNVDILQFCTILINR